MPSLGRPLSLAEKRAFQLSTLSLGGAKGREAFGDSIRVEREILRVQNLMHSLSPSISLSFRLAPHSQLFRTPPPELKASKLPPRRLLLVSRNVSNGSIASKRASGRTARSASTSLRKLSLLLLLHFRLLISSLLCLSRSPFVSLDTRSPIVVPLG